MYSSVIKSSNRLEIATDNSLNIKNIQRHHEGNYTCQARNAVGSDQIVYQLIVQVPPGPPDIKIMSSSTTSITLEWHLSGKYFYNKVNTNKGRRFHIGYV